MPRHAHMLGGAALLLALAHPAAAQLVGGPLTGASSNFMPFGGFSNVGTPPANTYQQIYNASAFTGPTAISTVRFFRAGTAGGDYRGGTYELFLSTTSRSVNGTNTLDPLNFDGNRGADNVLFATLVLSGPAGPPGSSLDFTSATPFVYDPALGNLLVDIRVSGGGPNPTNRISMIARNGDATSANLFSRAHNFSSTPMYQNNWGLVTEFVPRVSTVPEPSTYLLLATGMAGLAFATRRRRA